MLFINNGIYGMTGGQMAPTSLIGQVTSTSPYGREAAQVGNPIKIADMLCLLPGAYYVTRQIVHNPNGVRKLKKALIKAFEYQKQKKELVLLKLFQIVLPAGK